MGRESSLALSAAGDTNIGAQRANADYHRYDTELGLFAVAHGLSERPAARVAAETAVDALFAYVGAHRSAPPSRRDEFERALAWVNRHVRDEAAKEEHLRGMATTLACVFAFGRLLVIGQVGNCRVMRFRKGRIEPLTADPRKRDSPPRAIGLADGVIPDVTVEVIHAEDGVLLATAGLTGVLDDSTIAVILKHASGPQAAVKDLIAGALRRGAPENLTCIHACWR